MENNKELLEATVKGLQEKIESLQTELNVKTIELKNVNKPELLQSVFDTIYDCVNDGISEFDFDDNENYDIEYQLDYDGRVGCSSIDFQSTDELIDKIVANVCNLFKEVDDNEELDTTELDNHKPL